MKTNKEWKELLSLDTYTVLREKGTEPAFTGKYKDHFEQGIQLCAGCGTELFESSSKFNSHCGWPAFDEAKDNKVMEVKDATHGMIRVEILCTNCGGHLGHVFPDGPNGKPRFCINATVLDFKTREAYLTASSG